MPLDPEVCNWLVLIVDDEPDNLGVASKVLSFMGATVETAQNGIDGLAKLKDLRPTFILLDLSMPHMSGWEMLTHIRADEAIKHIPVIALTAHAMHGDKERALEAGFNWYISKPFYIRSFLDELKACLAQAQQHSGAFK